jgi:YggT family protein
LEKKIMLNPLNNAFFFLVSTLFDLYIFVLLIRLILAGIRADYYNPISQLVIKLTQPVIGPLRRMIPNYKTLELSSLVAVLLFELLKYFLIGLMLVGIPNPAGLVILAIADAGRNLLNIFFYAILLQAILSWVQAGYSPVYFLLTKITTPIIRPIQRVIPPLGGFDISPIPAMLLLQLGIILVFGPLFVMGQVMAFG